MGIQALRLLATLTTECASIDHLSAAVETAFQKHPDYDIITSFPGIAAQAGARLLGEIGDDRTRFFDARSLKAFAGAAPVTRASGRSLVVSQRRIKNDRLAAVGLHLGAVSAQPVTRRASPLRPTPHRRRRSRRRLPSPVQPLPRLPPSLPENTAALPRNDGLPNAGRSRCRCLTATPIGCLVVPGGVIRA
ncbi:transposase [Micromonospora sp. NPDC023633]|uniref:transposase n=1 Tax=Micromonospora sp. NPDC023633 TaxID=3154320 RepID=UPI0033CD542F